MNPSLKHLTRAANRAVDIILPPRCVVSGEMVDKQGMITGTAWAKLGFIGDPFCRHCGVPFEFEVEKGVTCASCIERPPPYKSARAALRYDEHSRDMILGFKHGDQTHAVLAFIPWLERAGEEMLKEADILIPVPLHYRRLIKRRYNQAAILAKALEKSTAIKADVSALKRIRATQVQGHLKTGERHKNVKAAFCVNPKADLKGKTVILIDDVFTTGATVKECTKELLKADVKNVHVLTLARAVREAFF